MDEAELRGLLAEHARAAGVVGAAVGIACGDAVTVATFGHADAEGTPIAADTRFAIASVTKPMVATAVVRLVEQGGMTLDDVLAERVPELARSPWATTATVRQLLANTSGVPVTAAREWTLTDNEDGALERFTLSLAAEPPMWEPGSAWGYSNSAWSVLGRVIECVTGVSWEDAMRQHVFHPLGMGSTEFGHEPARGPRSSAFQADAAGTAACSPWLSRAIAPGGASVHSTVGDLVAFGRAHCDDPSLAVLREEHARPGFAWLVPAWCLGLARFDGAGGSVWGWDGIGSGFRAILRIVPDHRGVVALLANTSTGRDLYRTLVPLLLEDAFGTVLSTPSTSPPADPLELDAYEGRFGWSDLEATVRVKGDRLRVTTPLDEHDVRPIDARSFLLEGDGADRMTYGFSAFDEVGAPQVFHRLIWGLPRIG